MANFEFKCVSADGDDLCFNNGTCYQTTFGTERCACPDGFSPDLFFFHFDNCVGRSGATITWLPFAVCYAVIYLVITFLLVRIMPTLTRREKFLCVLTIVAWTFTILFVISSVIQEGCYESCAIFSTLAFMCDYFALHLAVVLIMEALQRGTTPVATAGSAREDPNGHHLSVVTTQRIFWFRFFTFLLILGCFCSGVCMLIFTRREDRRGYNIATLCNCIFLWLAGIFFCSSIVIFSNALEAKINEAIQVAKRMNSPNTSPNIVRLKLRLKALRYGGWAVGIPFFMLLVPFPVTLSYLGSIPYYFVISMLHFVCNILVVLGIFGFLSRFLFATSSSSFAAGTSNNNMMTSTNQIKPAPT